MLRADIMQTNQSQAIGMTLKLKKTQERLTILKTNIILASNH
jgi:hypothetical protein